MALDRQSIEKRDFPIGRRGYEPGAVDEHLAMLADEVDALRGSAGRPTRTESLATTASESVRSIVEAAEQSAADIHREAELEARQVRQDAREEAETARSEAGSQARQHVDRVSTSTATMLERADVLESEFKTMLETIRESSARLGRELQALQAAVGTLQAQTPSATAEPAVVPPSPHIPAYDGGRLPGAPEFAVMDGDSGPDPELVPEPELVLEEPFEDEPAAVAPVGDDAPGDSADDEEGARLIALNMALNGTPREETERYLEDNFELADAEGLLDDVYARAGQ